MARVCALTGKKPQFGNNRSHAMNKTRRRFNPNLQTTRLYSETLGRQIKLRLSADALRSVEHRGGIDAFLIKASANDLTLDARRMKKQIEAAAAKA